MTSVYFVFHPTQQLLRRLTILPSLHYRFWAWRKKLACDLILWRPLSRTCTWNRCVFLFFHRFIIVASLACYTWNNSKRTKASCKSQSSALDYETRDANKKKLEPKEIEPTRANHLNYVPCNFSCHKTMNASMLFGSSLNWLILYASLGSRLLSFAFFLYFLQQCSCCWINNGNDLTLRPWNTVFCPKIKKCMNNL